MVSRIGMGRIGARNSILGPEGLVHGCLQHALLFLSVIRRVASESARWLGVRQRRLRLAEVVVGRVVEWMWQGLNTRVRARRGLRVPPVQRGRAGTDGGGRSSEPLRLMRACVGRARRGQAKAYNSGMTLHNQKDTGKPKKRAYTNIHAAHAHVMSGRQGR
eukprot:3869411-Pleurochrysis_carterae.AAC.3